MLFHVILGVKCGYFQKRYACSTNGSKTSQALVFVCIAWYAAPGSNLAMANKKYFFHRISSLLLGVLYHGKMQIAMCRGRVSRPAGGETPPLLDFLAPS